MGKLQLKNVRNVMGEMSGDTQGECLCVYAIIQDMILGALETMSGL